jgi:hypothetical protein
MPVGIGILSGLTVGPGEKRILEVVAMMLKGKETSKDRVEIGM